MRRRILWSLAFLPVAALALGELTGWPFLREPAEQVLSRRLERRIRLAPPFHLHLLGGISLEMGGVWIAAPDGFDVPHFLDARNISLDLRYGDLLGLRNDGALRIAALDIDRIDLQLVRHQDGQASWQFGKQDWERPPPLPFVDRLQVRQGTLAFRDSLVDADLNANFGARQETPGATPAMHAEARGQFRQRPLVGKLTAGGRAPAAPVAIKASLAYGGIEGNFDGDITNPSGRSGVMGSIALKGPSLGLLGRLVDKPLPNTGPFSLHGKIAHEAEVWHIDIDTAKVGASRLTGRFIFDPAPAPPRLDGELAGRYFVLADLAPAFGTRNEDGTPVAPPPGRVIPDRPLNLPGLKKLDARIKVNLEHVDLGSAFAQPIAPLKATLTLNQGQLALSDLDAVTAKGRLSGAISIDARPSPPLWQSDLAWDDIRLEDWFKSATARTKANPRNSGKATPPPYFTGTLHGRAKLAGRGHSTAKLLGSLDGDVTVFVRHGSLSHLVVEILGLDVAQGLGLVLSGDESLPIRCAVADLQAKQGVLAPRVALIDTPVTLVLGDGSIDLAKERLDLRVTARPKDVSPLTLRSPIHLRGSFVKPTATPEPGPIAARILGGIVLAFANPLAAIIPFIDPGDATTSPCRQSLAALKR